MARLTGQTSVAVNADILMNSPFDTRSWTPYYSGLTDGTIPQPYKGMLVSVYDDVESKNGLYFCTDVGGIGVITTENTEWVKVGSDIASITSSTFVVSAGTLNFSGTTSASTFQTSGIFNYVNNITLSGNSLSGYTNTSGNTPVFGGVVNAATGGYLSGSTLYLTGTGFLSSGTTISGFGTLTSNPFTGGTSSAGTGGTTALTATLVGSGQTPQTTIDLENVLTFTNESTTKRQVGGIPSGSLLFQSGKTIHQILQEIFYPVDSPSITDITAVLSRNSGGVGEFSVSQYQIVGTTGNITLSSVYTSGTSQVGSNISTNRKTGPVSAFTYSGPGVENGTYIQPSTSNTDGYSLSATPYTVVLGNNTWTGSISYNTGQQPVDDSFQSYNDADTVQFTQPGTKTTNSVIIEGVYPISASTGNGNINLIQQTLVSMVSNSNIPLTLPAETVAPYKQRFILPEPLKDRFKRFELYNGTTGNYDTVPIAEFATITFFDTLTINGNNVDYWLYQYNKPDPTDESKIKLFFF